MAIRNALPFEFPYRWPDLRRFVSGLRPGEDEADEAVDYLDQRDRDLEDFLAGLGGGDAKLPYYIAASDATDESKALSNYVCTGTDDQDVIQQCVTDYAAGSIAAPIVLSEGNFYLSGPVDMTGIVPFVRGRGKDETIINRSGAKGTDNAFTCGAAPTIEGMRFVGFYRAIYHATTSTQQAGTIRECWFSACDYGVRVRRADYSTINDCVFFDAVTAIETLECDRMTITNNRFFSSSSYDVLCSDFGAATITGNTSWSSETCVRLVDYAYALNISDNVFDSVQGTGISIVGGVGDNLYGGTISDNYINAVTNCLLADGPVIATNDVPLVVSGNQMVGSAVVDVRCMVTGNYIKSGITLNDPCDKALVSNNWLGDHGLGAGSSTFTDNTTGAIVSTGAGNYLDGTWTP